MRAATRTKLVGRSEDGAATDANPHRRHKGRIADHLETRRRRCARHGGSGKSETRRPNTNGEASLLGMVGGDSEFVADPNSVPQDSQNRAPVSFVAPHRWQFIPGFPPPHSAPAAKT